MLHVVLAFSSFVVPAIVVKLGERYVPRHLLYINNNFRRKAIFIGGFTYIIYFIANIDVIPALLLVASGITGFGASLLWTSQASFLMKNSTKETIGRNSGIFFGFYQLNQFIGNLIAARIVRSGDPGQTQKTLFIAFTVVSITSVISFFALRPIPKSDDMIEPPLYNFKILKRLGATAKILIDKKFLMLMFIIAYNGIFQAFMSGSFTKELGKIYLNNVMAAFGIAGAIGSFIFGKIIDILGRKPILITSSVLVFSGSLLSLLPRSYLQETSLIYYIIAVMFGLGDSACLNVLYATIGNLYSTDVETGFGAFKLVQSLATGTFFVLAPYITIFYFEVMILDIFLLIGLLFFLLLDFFIADVDKEGGEQIQWIVQAGK